MVQELLLYKPDIVSFCSGDLNHGPGAPEFRSWIDAGLIDTLRSTGECSSPRTLPSSRKGRLDYIRVHGPLAKRLESSRVLNEGAFRTNRMRHRIEWDPLSFRITNRREANQYLRREYRRGWDLQEIAGSGGMLPRTHDTERTGLQSSGTLSAPSRMHIAGELTG